MPEKKAGLPKGLLGGHKRKEMWLFSKSGLDKACVAGLIYRHAL